MASWLVISPALEESNLTLWYTLCERNNSLCCNQVASRHAPLHTQSSVAARTRLMQMRSPDNHQTVVAVKAYRLLVVNTFHKVCIQVFRFPPHNGLDVTVTFITEVIILITRYRGHRTDILSCDHSCDRNRIISTFYSQHTDINEPTATPGMSHVISVTHRQQPEVYGSILVSCHRFCCIFIFPVTIFKKADGKWAAYFSVYVCEQKCS